MEHPPPIPRRLWISLLLLVLLIAAALRLVHLPQLPVGLHYDEAANGILAHEIARGDKTPIFIPSYTGKEPLFFYWTALWMRVLGPTPLALRLSAALIGIATVAAAAWATRELAPTPDTQWTPLLTAALLAASFWHLLLSRVGFRAVTQPLLQALTVGALWRGLRLSSPPARTKLRGIPWLLLAGLLCGLTAYTYLAARAFPIPLAAALLTLILAARDRRARLAQSALFVTAAAAALAPLAHYWLTHPGSFLTRAQQVAAANWAEAWAGMRACLSMLFLRGDPYIRFNLPHRPLFDPLTAALGLIGLAALVLSLKRPSQTPDSPPALRLAAAVLLLVALPTMLLPSALATGEITPSNLRAVGLLPFVYLFPALGLSTLASTASRILPPPSRLPPTALPTALLLLTLVLATPATAAAYFGDWAASAPLYYASDGDLTAVAAYLNRADLATATPYVASIHYRHPTLAFLAEDYSAIRWLTGGHTVVFPPPSDGSDGLLILPHSAASDRAWIESVLPADSLVDAPLGPDGAPAFHAYRVAPTPGLTPTHPLTANLAHIVHLLGYDAVRPAQGSARAEVAVWWRVLNRPQPGDYAPIARLTDPWGFVWGESIPFHYPAEQWTPGEVIVDHLAIPVAPGAPPGDYAVRFGLYSPSADTRLPRLDDAGRYAGSTVQLDIRLDRAPSPPHPDDLDIRHRLEAPIDGLTLLGFNLDTTAARPGEPLFLTLFWQAETAPRPNQTIALTLGKTTLYRGAPVHDTYPTSQWTAGEIVADRYGPRLPRTTPPGEHALRLDVGDQTIELGTVAVPALTRAFDAPSISHPLSVTLGQQVRLLGYDLSSETLAPGETLTLTLYWQARAEMDTGYTVFTHLLAPDGSFTGQRDNPPVNGAYPTPLWMTGEVVTDVYHIPIRADAPPGEHRLEVGMYVAEDGTRLPVTPPADGDVDAPDAVLLQTITLR